ncbi:uncharacterized protein LOC135811999 isoform X1 [Sycon ciliatum]|uniref:uncharacterized protein LOC135811999 isoform X1 n=1 Tax=Sycon ciliatum TaxID=27933 RepID=UPI0031F7066A
MEGFEKVLCLPVNLCESMKGVNGKEALENIRIVTEYIAKHHGIPLEWREPIEGIYSVQRINDVASEIQSLTVTEKERVTSILLIDDSNRLAISLASSQQSNTLQPVYNALKELSKGRLVCIVCKDEKTKIHTVSLRSTVTFDKAGIQLGEGKQDGEQELLLSIWTKASAAQGREVARVMLGCHVGNQFDREPLPKVIASPWSLDFNISGQSTVAPGKSRCRITIGTRAWNPEEMCMQRIHLHYMYIKEREENKEFQLQIFRFQDTCIPHISGVQQVSLTKWTPGKGIPQGAKDACRDTAKSGGDGSDNTLNIAVIVDTADLVYNRVNGKLAELCQNLTDFDHTVLCLCFDIGFMEPGQDIDKCRSARMTEESATMLSEKDLKKVGIVSWNSQPPQAVADEFTAILLKCGGSTARKEAPFHYPTCAGLVVLGIIVGAFGLVVFMYHLIWVFTHEN